MSFFPMSRRQYRIAIVILWCMSGAALLLGGLIYYRNDAASLTLIAKLHNHWPEFDRHLHALAAELPNWLVVPAMRAYAPDFLWAFALAIALILIWHRVLRWRWLALLSIAAALSFEVAQGFGWVSGIFDWFDIMVSLVAALFALLLVYFTARGQSTEQNDLV
ncbi:MAG: hypothetical protein HWE13_11870 [Gammaproteobacteria bacterium]|nr:hypothetical protein [Gammaproteobacteria bacterium]